MGDVFKPESFIAHRFNKIGDPSAHDPVSALVVAQEWIAQQENKPHHVIVFVGRTTEDGSSGTKYFQAGNYPAHAQIGLCMEGMLMLRGSG
jgi:hypothetical protein